MAMALKQQLSYAADMDMHGGAYATFGGQYKRRNRHQTTTNQPTMRSHFHEVHASAFRTGTQFG